MNCSGEERWIGWVEEMNCSGEEEEEKTEVRRRGVWLAALMEE